MNILKFASFRTFFPWKDKKKLGGEGGGKYRVGRGTGTTYIFCFGLNNH